METRGEHVLPQRAQAPGRQGPTEVTHRVAEPQPGARSAPDAHDGLRGRNQDRGDRGWQNINQRQRALDARIDAGLRDRSLSRTEAYRLRAEFQQIARIEQDYRRNGLSQAERRDLDRRFDRLSYRVEAERRDRDNHYG